ncbi:molybdopterin molybdotransferase MoeA [Neotamlana laminarinivorans]|uniref:Molybdopterin molybdenumtransferase n=1 Tax=Neotamlana laminarinivorans TaxID=2883124 RepID=A0A9X1L3C1_9FLAO|nr:gephyrin-like molybdotransferase Glp [Tamlana laminarinivorans]MCB4798102.1 molybdopterin molybdotransferase MoeA [Tamlana laminarinivorans]
MITINDAISKIKASISPSFKTTIKTIEKANGYVLANNIISPINMPPFRQSAMDGYALNLHDSLTYKLIDEVKAGDPHQPILKPGEAVRIFTGAAVPDTANAIMMQEKVKTNGKQITVQHNITQNLNIRPLGEQVKKGDIALKKETKLNPAAIGYLTSLGITEVSVIKKPDIAIITTGNELVEPGTPLKHGQIYESNSKMLQTALYGLKFYNVTLHKVEDNYEKTLQLLNSVIKTNDLAIITGGISVGDYDFVGKALKELKVNEIFYKVKQKPGKPLFFGKKNNTSIFALPGNPAAALSCFYIYVYMALQKMMNRTEIELPRKQAISSCNFTKKGDRPQFLKAIYSEGKVEILEGQNSSMLQTFALSNALVFIPEDTQEVKINDTVETILLPV